jgi:hypothetical protein
MMGAAMAGGSEIGEVYCRHSLKSDAVVWSTRSVVVVWCAASLYTPQRRSERAGSWKRGEWDGVDVGVGGEQ